MQQRMNPVVGVVLMVSVLSMAATAIILWVNQRPTPEDEVSAEELVQEGPVIDESTGDASAGLVGYDVTVEGHNVQLVTVPGHEKLTVYVPPSEPVVVVEEQPAEADEQPIVVVEGQPAETEEQPVVVVVEEGEPPTPTPIVAVVQPVVVEDPAPTPVPTVVVVNGQSIVFVSHSVQAGDTMYNVAQRLGSSVELMAENGISSEDMIVGATISVPVANHNYCQGMIAYVVRDADTVYSIATRHNVDKDRIRDQNNLGAEYSIKAGQVICIPSS